MKIRAVLGEWDRFCERYNPLERLLIIGWVLFLVGGIGLGLVLYWPVTLGVAALWGIAGFAGWAWKKGNVK